MAFILRTSSNTLIESAVYASYALKAVFKQHVRIQQQKWALAEIFSVFDPCRTGHSLIGCKVSQMSKNRQQHLNRRLK